MSYDLTKSTRAAANASYDLRKSAQTPPSGKSAMTLTRSRQSIGGASVNDVTTVAKSPGAKGAKPIAAKAKKGR